MAIKSSTFKSLFPEFASDCRVDVYIALAEQRISKDCYGDMYESAVCFLAAHILTMVDRGGSGAIQGERVGEVSVVYGSASNARSEFELTPYGRQFATMRAINRKTPAVLNAC